MKLNKNYFILFFIYLVTIFAVFYCVSLYNKANVFSYDDSIGMFILDVSDYNKLYDNINNYAFENSNFIVCYSSRGVSSNLEDIIIDYDLSYDFLYINDFVTLNKILVDFGDISYSFNENDNYLVYFSNGKIVDIVNCSFMDYDGYKNYFSKVGLI